MEEMGLATETNTPEMQAKIMAAFEAFDCAHEIDNAQAHFEHGQWWIVGTPHDPNTGDDATFSVNDAEDTKGNFYFDFERLG